jgi:putative intracellular protease/amidase
MTYYPQEALLNAHGNVIANKAWASHVERDAELITAQNPNSVEEFTKIVLSALK